MAKYRCPKCGCEEFIMTTTVIEINLVDKNLDIIKNKYNECYEGGNMLTCANCDYEARMSEFEVREIGND